MPTPVKAVDDQYVHGTYGAGRCRVDSREPSVSGQRRTLSRPPRPGGPVVLAYEPVASARAVRQEVVHAIGNGHSYGDVQTLDAFEDMGLTDLFQKQCPGWAVPKDLMAISLIKLSQHHPGHLRVRSMKDILNIANTKRAVNEKVMRDGGHKPQAGDEDADVPDSSAVAAALAKALAQYRAAEEEKRKST